MSLTQIILDKFLLIQDETGLNKHGWNTFNNKQQNNTGIEDSVANNTETSLFAAFKKDLGQIYSENDDQGVDDTFSRSTIYLFFSKNKTSSGFGHQNNRQESKYWIVSYLGSMISPTNGRIHAKTINKCWHHSSHLISLPTFNYFLARE